VKKFSFAGKSKNKTKQKKKKTILFVCVENAARSQMAEAFFRRYAPQEEGYEPLSAGTRPSGEINPLAIQVMKEIGIDISSSSSSSKQKSKDITEDMMRNSERIVNMGCMDKSFCPTLFLNNVIDWNIEDPKGKSIEKVREIRDIIEQRVKELVSNLSTSYYKQINF
jgi:arsenate reductase (thioredoxin)